MKKCKNLLPHRTPSSRREVCHCRLVGFAIFNPIDKKRGLVTISRQNLQKHISFFNFFDRQAAGDVFDSFKTVRHARARAQVRGSAGNRTGSCVGKAGVRLPACPKNAMSERLPVRIQHFFILFGQAGDRTRLRRFQNCAPRSSESSKSEQAGNRTRQRQRNALPRPVSDYLPARKVPCPPTCMSHFSGQASNRTASWT